MNIAVMIVTLPFIGKDITHQKVYEVINKLCIGFIKSIVINENQDSIKKFRSADIEFYETFDNSHAYNIFRQLGKGGEVVIKMHKYKTSRWILRNYCVGSMYGVRPSKNQKRIYVDI